MIGYSDNNATYVLFYSIDSGYFDHVLNDLHIDNKIAQNQNVISLKEYTKLFRVLYNATYLNQEMSQKAMEYLLINLHSLSAVSLRLCRVGRFILLRYLFGVLFEF